MKKLVIALIVLVSVAVTSFCIYDAMFYNAWPELKELPRFKSKEIYSVENFTDCTYYAKFTYKNVSVEDLKKAVESFEKVTEDNAEKIMNSISEYESFISNINGMDEVRNAYDFDKSVVNDGDYYYTESGEGFYQDEDGNFTDTGFITLYYFDIESQILYYFHNCI